MAGDSATSTNTWVRTFFIAALLVPVLASVLSIQRDVVGGVQADCTSITRELERVDAAGSIGEQAVLILGNHRVRRWREPPTTVGDKAILMRGSPALTPRLIADCFQRSVAYYRPALAVIFLEPEDVYDHSERTHAALNTIADRRRYYDVAPRLAIVPPIPTPADASQREVLQQFNSALNEWAAGHTGIMVMHLDGPLLNENGQPEAPLFWPDGQTLSDQGYQRFGEALEGALRRHLL